MTVVTQKLFLGKKIWIFNTQLFGLVQKPFQYLISAMCPFIWKQRYREGMKCFYVITANNI